MGIHVKLEPAKLIKIVTIYICLLFQDTISFITSGIAVGLNLAINAYQFLDIAGLRDETRSNLAIINTNTEESRFIVFIPLLTFFICIKFDRLCTHFDIFDFSYCIKSQCTRLEFCNKHDQYPSIKQQEKANQFRLCIGKYLYIT